MRQVFTLFFLLAAVQLVVSLYQETPIQLQQTGAATAITFPTLDSSSKFLYWIQQDAKTRDNVAWLYRKDVTTQASMVSTSTRLSFSLDSVRFMNIDASSNVFVGYWRKKTDTEGDLVLSKHSDTGSLINSAVIMGSGSYRSTSPASAVIGDDKVMYVISTTDRSPYTLTITAVNTDTMYVLKTATLPYDGTKTLPSITSHYAKGILYLQFQNSLVSMQAYPAMTKIRQLNADISTSILDASNPSPTLYAVNSAGSYLQKIDLYTMSITKSLFLSMPSNKRWLAFNPADKQKLLYVYSNSVLLRVRTSDFVQVESYSMSYSGTVRGFEISRASNSRFLYLISADQWAYVINQGCQSGTYITEGYCTPCGLGTYSNLRDQTSCTKCSPGYYQPYSGATSCLACGEGYFASQYGASICDACEPGTYSSFTGSKSCTPCRPGTYTSRYESNFCSSCDIGFYAKSYGSTKCTPCWVGSVSSGGASTCTNCTAGYYSFSSWYCASCSSGTFSTGLSNSCTDCPVGTYTSKVASKSCEPCESATTSGQSYCNDYPAGPFIWQSFFTIPVIGLIAFCLCCCCFCLCLCSCASKRGSTTTTITKPATVSRPAQVPRPVAPAQQPQYYQTYQSYQAAPINQQQPVQYQQPTTYTKGAPVYYQQSTETQPVMYSSSLAQHHYPVYQTE